MNENVPTRLKRLRESAGLSIRALRELLGRSGSGYAHYERPDRFKDPFLPMDLAQDLARALAPYGIDRAAVMALARTTVQPPAAGPDSRAPAASGFAEDAARPWEPPRRTIAQPEQMMRLLAPAALKPAMFRMQRAIPALALAAGDVLIVDQKRLPDAGELALANARTDHGAVTVVGRWLPPILVTDETLAVGRLLDPASGAVALYHPILAVLRLTGSQSDR